MIFNDQQLINSIPVISIAGIAKRLQAMKWPTNDSQHDRRNRPPPAEWSLQVRCPFSTGWAPRGVGKGPLVICGYNAHWFHLYKNQCWLIGFPCIAQGRCQALVPKDGDRRRLLGGSLCSGVFLLVSVVLQVKVEKQTRTIHLDLNHLITNISWYIFLVSNPLFGYITLPRRVPSHRGGQRRLGHLPGARQRGRLGHLGLRHEDGRGLRAENRCLMLFC